jgi:hypothetical protein
MRIRGNQLPLFSLIIGDEPSDDKMFDVRFFLILTYHHIVFMSRYQH